MENIVIRQNIFRGVALTLGGIQNLILEDNIFYGTASSPDYNTIIDFSFGEYQDSYIYGAVVSGNIFYKVHRHPHNRVGWDAVVAGFIRIVGATWANNVFIDPDSVAIYIQDVTAPGTTLDVRGVELVGNVIIGQGKTNAGIVVRQGRVTIKGNYIENTNDVAVAITNSEAVIEGNYIADTPTAGIWVTHSRAAIIGNILRECAKSRDKCIVIDGTSAYNTIIGNRFYRTVTSYLARAVDTSTTNYNIIMGNVAEGQFDAYKYAYSSTDIVSGNI